MTKVKLEILGLSSSVDTQTGSFALVLKEEKGERRLPIIIGMFEAQSIAMEIEKIIITDIKDGVFFAKIEIDYDGKNLSIDSRPSDAIAIGIRFNAEIYADEKVINEAGILFDEVNVDKGVTKKSDSVKTLKDMSDKELKDQLNSSITEENYEFAARIRDEIKKRN